MLFGFQKYIGNDSGIPVGADDKKNHPRSSNLIPHRKSTYICIIMQSCIMYVCYIYILLRREFIIQTLISGQYFYNRAIKRIIYRKLETSHFLAAVEMKVEIIFDRRMSIDVFLTTCLVFMNFSFRLLMAGHCSLSCLAVGTHGLL